MTWHAQRGPTVLQGSEAKMFAEAVEDFCDDIQSLNDGESSQLIYGPSSFNLMTSTQQAASIELVTKALFQESSDPFPLVAWSECTLAAILGIIKCSIDYEIDTAESTKVRDLIDGLTNSEVSPEKKDWDSHAGWELTFECYESQFLWDHDFEVSTFLDVALETSRKMGAMLGIDGDYHSTIPPDLKSDHGLGDCLERIGSVIQKFL